MGIRIYKNIYVNTCVYMYVYLCVNALDERWGAGVEYHFQEFNEPYAPS